MARHRNRMPAWVLGLVLAAAVFAIALLVFSALGFGDDPVVEGIQSLG